MVKTKKKTSNNDRVLKPNDFNANVVNEARFGFVSSDIFVGAKRPFMSWRGGNYSRYID